MRLFHNGEYFSGKDGAKVTTVVATPGSGSDRPQEVSYTDTKVIGNGSFGVVYQAKLVETNELVAIKKVLQDERFKVSDHNVLPRFSTHLAELFSSSLESRIANNAQIGASKHR